MVFSGVAGSRPAREVPLADGDGKRTIKPRSPEMTCNCQQLGNFGGVFRRH
jgi:hypothetical protein